jgi:mono/diheme cytochrome c family protein
MNLFVLLAVLIVFGLLRWRRAPLLMWALAWWVGIYVLLRFGFTAPIPASVVTMYMAIVTLAICAYMSSSQPRRDEIARPLIRLMTEKRFAALLGAVVVAIPALAAANVYMQMSVPIQPPLFSRTVHPASPSEITVHDKKIDLDNGENPYRQLESSHPAEFRAHVEHGRQVFYRNCVFCHGDNLSGNGMFVHGLDPIPTNFTDKGTIAMLRETFLFWRISKGGPGLPEEGGPWDTAMPAWEKFLKEDDIWDAILFLYDFTGQRPRAKEGAAQTTVTPAVAHDGKSLYMANCSQCHGEKGDGEGYAAPHLRPRPRNFTTGKFKVRTTPNGALPTDQDLTNVIRRGMPYTSMPAWPALSDADVAELVKYIKTFSPEFAKPENAPKPIDLPSAPRATKETAEQGKKLFEDNGCIRCHGSLGRGDGPSAPTLTDDWGRPIRVADLAQNWTFRGGNTREDIFRTMSTGFNGTPMPSFADALKPEQRWAITDYIVSLAGTDNPGYTNLVTARHVQEPIDLQKGAAAFASAPAARFPIIGQIMEPGREFHPPATSVQVQALYDTTSIAILMRWHDMSAQKSGQNGPSLPVPPEEEEEAAAPGGSTSANPFGDQEVTPAPGGGQPANPFGEAAEPAAPASEFSDAVSIQIPSQVPAGPRKPYFLLGDAQNSVDLWFFDLAKDAPARFTGKGSADVQPNPDLGDLTGVASYDQGEWSVIFKRPLKKGDTIAPFSPGEFMPIAFSVWDGFSRERGNRRGLTLWYSLYMEPEVVPSAAGPMARTALILLALELGLIGWVRWRERTRGLSGGTHVQEYLRSR